jgi:hypothetical protein
VTQIDPQSAASALDDIERIERRATEERRYIGAASTYFLWGGLTGFGYLLSQFAPAYAEGVWHCLLISGVVGMVLIDRRGRKYSHVSAGRRIADFRPLYVQVMTLVFVYLWYFLLGGTSVGHREAAIFFPTVFMFSLAVAGLWIGRYIAYSGLAVAASLFAVYLWSGPWFNYLMALCCGGGLILVGWLFRRMDKHA